MQLKYQQKDQLQKVKIKKNKKNKNKKKNKKRKNLQKFYYSGKKHRHTIKTQVVVHKKTQQIICTHFSEGKKHDFALFKESNLPFQQNQTIIVDSGYTGILKLFPNAIIPIKKNSKKNNKSKQETSKINTEISLERVTVENVIGDLKKFRILSNTYRCRRKRFTLRFNLIAGIYNFELGLQLLIGFLQEV